VAKAADWGVDAVLVDSPRPGSGQVFDWALAEAPGGMRLILAGGLNEHNVSDAIAIVRPWGVDVVSGVESTPGHKDARKLRAFIVAARRAAAAMRDAHDEPTPDEDVMPYDWQDEGD
jgi:phosphoribosylanthranilate isomerase